MSGMRTERRQSEEMSDSSSSDDEDSKGACQLGCFSSLKSTEAKAGAEAVLDVDKGEEAAGADGESGELSPILSLGPVPQSSPISRR